MPDREKVIKSIEGCINIGDYCNDCDYDGCIYTHGSCEKDLLADALALLKEQEEEIENLKHTAQSMMEGICLLKEQEAVEPILIREGRNKNYNDYVCPRCDNEVVYEQNYCSECGVPFLWEGR